ncbi:hypothetical protein KUCAC02_026667 [Chaenocephalus aceratus]|nr:hypothetical protein KUCAC02_026667 [Chaenocephalus aceratus]
MDNRTNSSLGLPDYFLSGDVLDYEIPLDEIPDTTQGRAFFVATIVIAVVLVGIMLVCGVGKLSVHRQPRSIQAAPKSHQPADR